MQFCWATYRERATIGNMKSSKARGPNSVSVEPLEALAHYKIDKIATLLNAIYDTGLIEPEISKFIFIALPKKPGTIKCVLHKNNQPYES